MLVVHLALHPVEAVSAFDRQDAGLLGLPGDVAGMFGVERQYNVGYRGALQPLERAADGAFEGHIAIGFLIAHADQQHALGGDTGETVQQQGAADLAGDVAGGGGVRDGALGGGIQVPGVRGQFLGVVYADDDAIGFEFREVAAFYAKFHEVSPCALRIASSTRYRRTSIWRKPKLSLFRGYGVKANRRHAGSRFHFQFPSRLLRVKFSRALFATEPVPRICRHRLVGADRIDDDFSDFPVGSSSWPGGGRFAGTGSGDRPAGLRALVLFAGGAFAFPVYRRAADAIAQLPR